MDVVFIDKLFLQDHLHRNNDLSHDDQKVSYRTWESSRIYFNVTVSIIQQLWQTATSILPTCDDITEFVLFVLVLAQEVSQANNHQAQDGGEDAKPLAGQQASAQERDGEQTGEDDDGSTQHLEAGGAGHVERCKQ